jgi:cysteine-rich repeat protein
MRNRYRKIAVNGLFALMVAATPAAAADKPIGGKLLKMKTDRGASKHLVLFKAVKESNISGIGNPGSGATLLMRWNSGALSGRSEAIALDPAKWKGLGKPAGLKGWKYSDKEAARGGVKVLLIKPNGLLKILAKGAGWAWGLPGTLDDASVDLYLGGDQYCAAFGPGNGDIKKNTATGFLLVKDFAAPGSCEPAICGNGAVEAGENCDDGNLDDGDFCANDCTAPQVPPTTLATLQSKIFTAGCAISGSCHTGTSPAMGLDLSAGAMHSATVGVSAALSPGLLRIDPTSGNADTSFVYIKLAAGAGGGSYPGLVGDEMPPDGALTADCLAGLAEWIEAGAPGNGNVPSADALLGGPCF